MYEAPGLAARFFVATACSTGQRRIATKRMDAPLAVMEVLELTPDRYAERVAFRIEPDWLPNIHGCHTIAMADDLIALDCKAFKWWR
jgi:hypothetical protein